MKINILSPARVWVFTLTGASCILAQTTFAQNGAIASPPSSLLFGKDTPSRWSVELGSGTLFGNVRESHLDSYTLVPLTFGVSRTFDTVYLTNFAGGIFAGHAEVLADGYYTRVASGTEHYITGFHIGARHDFLHLGGRWTPFVETTVGAADADARQFYSNGDVHGLGEHFNFNFTVGTGVRYDITSRCFARLTAQYVHYSNGGLSEPQKQNKAIDCAGPLLSVGFRF